MIQIRVVGFNFDLFFIYLLNIKSPVNNSTIYSIFQKFKFP